MPQRVFISGVGGVDIYDVKTLTRVDHLPPGSDAYGAVTALKWVQRVGHGDDYLVIGTLDGYVLVWATSQIVRTSSSRVQTREDN